MPETRLYSAQKQYVQVLADPRNIQKIDLEISIVNNDDNYQEEHTMGTISVVPGKSAIIEIVKLDLLCLGISNFTHIKFNRINYTDSTIDMDYSVNVSLLKFTTT